MNQQWSRSGKKKDKVKLRNGNVLFCRFFKNLTLCMTKIKVLVVSFPGFTDISIILKS
jgi:hypothetical protein